MSEDGHIYYVFLVDNATNIEYDEFVHPTPTQAGTMPNTPLTILRFGISREGDELYILDLKTGEILDPKNSKEIEQEVATFNLKGERLEVRQGHLYCGLVAPK